MLYFGIVGCPEVGLWSRSFDRRLPSWKVWGSLQGVQPLLHEYQRLADFNWFDLTPMAILMAWDIVSSFDIASLGFASHRAYFMSSFSVSLAVGIFTSTM